MPMPNRNVEGGYRYGYQGEYAEKEPELGGGINSFQLRLWDSRIGRWSSPDPYGQFASPYLGMGNNPMNGVDPDGGCWDSEGNPCPDGAIGDTMVGGQGATWTFGENGWDTNAFDAYGVDLGTVYNSPAINANTTLWDFSSQLNQFKIDAKSMVDGGGMPSPYMINGYLDSYERSALTSGRTNVTFQDIHNVDAAAGNAFAMIVPVGRVLGGFNAFRGFRHAITLGKGGLAPVGRALQKHPNIAKVVTAGTITTNALRNSVGMKALQHIMRNGARTTKSTKAFGNVVDFKLASGLGARFNATTNEFIGFLGRGL